MLMSVYVPGLSVWLPVMLPVDTPPVQGLQGGVRYDIGSVAAGIPIAGQGPAWAVHVTALWPQLDPWPPVVSAVPATPKVPAQTVTAFPALKLPLSLIPQVGAFRTALPMTSTPSIAELGDPSVYKQPPPEVTPLTFVATARAVSVSLLIPRTFMK